MTRPGRSSHGRGRSSTIDALSPPSGSSSPPPAPSISYRRDEKQRAALWPAEALEGDAESLWVSEQSIELVTLARRLASSHLPILITGETGTGKEMLARVIHRASDRAGRPLVPFNCTAVPREMLESQLFGYRRGAFTGAETSFAGVIRSADGGTLFLDEIGDIGLELQPKLLRFIEQREVHPLGEPQPVKVDVRIIAATNANLEQLVAEGRFREDLFYRLKVLPLPLPPLRERREEIPALLQHYLQKFGDEQRKGRVTLSDETLEYLLLYAWPGNIRQLANEVQRMIALAEPDATVTPALLSPEIRASRRTLPVADAPAEPEIRLRLDQPLPAAVDTLEQILVRHALERSHGRVEEAARILGISRKGLVPEAPPLGPAAGIVGRTQGREGHPEAFAPVQNPGASIRTKFHECDRREPPSGGTRFHKLRLMSVGTPSSTPQSAPAVFVTGSNPQPDTGLCIACCRDVWSPDSQSRVRVSR